MNYLTDKVFTAYVGIDWADSKHDICVQAAGDQQREFDCISHQVDIRTIRAMEATTQLSVPVSDLRTGSAQRRRHP